MGADTPSLVCKNFIGSAIDEDILIMGDDIVALGDEPCKKGHLGLVYKSSGKCVECHALSLIYFKEKNEEKKSYYKEVRDARKDEYSKYLMSLAFNSKSFKEFWSALQDERESKGKKRWLEYNEVFYQYGIYHHICKNHPSVHDVSLENEDNDEGKRPDIVINSIKMVIEVKVGKAWEHNHITTQIDKYKNLYSGFRVVGTHPEGLYGLLTFEELEMAISEQVCIYNNITE